MVESRLSADELTRLGNEYFEKGDRVSAAEHWRAALELNPGDTQARERLQQLLATLADAPTDEETQRMDLNKLQQKLAESWVDSPADDLEVVVAPERVETRTTSETKPLLETEKRD